MQFPWSRRSAVAAKNFVLQTVQEFGGLDEAWVIVHPEREAFGLAELAPLALDEGLDNIVKGTTVSSARIVAAPNRQSVLCAALRLLRRGSFSAAALGGAPLPWAESHGLLFD